MSVAGVASECRAMLARVKAAKTPSTTHLLRNGGIVNSAAIIM
ncbi:hypothetical protein W823_14775 [Williamsia sp. D3]|nr:hypothetical protein W823_14775 [Williamsia sp. D3]